MSFPQTNMLLLRAKGLIVSNDDVLDYFDNRTTQSATITGSSEYLTGIYQEPDVGTYSGDINDLTEQQITDISNGDDFGAIAWSTLEKAWILENLNTTSVSGIKRYNFTFSSYDSGVLNIPVPNSGARGDWGSLEQAIFDGDELPGDFVPGSLPILQGSSVITDWDAELVGVADFLGTGYISLASVPDLSGTKNIEFYMWLDDIVYDGTTRRIFSWGNGDDYLLVSVTGSTDRPLLIIQCSSAANSGKNYLLDDYVGQPLFCRIEKTTQSIDAFRINGNLINPDSLNNYVTITNQSYIGAFSGGQLLSNIYVWDISILTVANWIGYPNGDTSAAWVDNIGSNDGTASGTLATKTLPAGGSGVPTNWSETTAGKYDIDILTDVNFFKNLLRIEALDSIGGRYFESDLIAIPSSGDYILSFRESADIGASSINVLITDESDNILGSYLNVMTQNNGIITQTESFSISVTGVKIRLLAPTLGTWLKIDEIELIKT
jgi:hypothetical protein